MRTTITMDEETAEMAKEYARSRCISLSKAISELIHRGKEMRPRIKYVDGWPVMDLPKPKRLLTTERVKELEDESWETMVMSDNRYYVNYAVTRSKRAFRALGFSQLLITSGSSSGSLVSLGGTPG